MRIILASIYPYAFFLLLLIIPFDDYVRAWPNILLGIIVVAWPFIVKKSDFKKLRSAPTFILLSLLAYLIINSIVLHRIDENMSVVTKALLAAGLLLLYLPVCDFKKVHKALIFSSLIAIVISIFNILMVIKDTGSFDMWHPLNPLDSLLIERLYLGLLCVLSIVVSYQGMTSTYNANNKYYLINIVINIAFVFLIVSRYAILTLVVLALLRLLYGNAKLMRVLGTVLITGIVVTFAFVFNENLKKRFLYITPDANVETPLLKKTIVSEPRTIIWECANSISESNDVLLKGLGFETTKSKLLECYNTIEDDDKRQKFLDKGFNSHNQFIDMYLSVGILPFLLLAALFMVVFFQIRKNYFQTALWFSIVFFALIENFLHRQMGAYYFGIILILLLIQQQDKKENAS